MPPLGVAPPTRRCNRSPPSRRRHTRGDREFLSGLRECGGHAAAHAAEAMPRLRDGMAVAEKPAAAWPPHSMTVQTRAYGKPAVGVCAALRGLLSSALYASSFFRRRF